MQYHLHQTIKCHYCSIGGPASLSVCNSHACQTGFAATPCRPCCCHPGQHTPALCTCCLGRQQCFHLPEPSSSVAGAAGVAEAADGEGAVGGGGAVDAAADVAAAAVVAAPDVVTCSEGPDFLACAAGLNWAVAALEATTAAADLAKGLTAIVAAGLAACAQCVLQLPQPGKAFGQSAFDAAQHLTVLMRMRIGCQLAGADLLVALQGPVTLQLESTGACHAGLWELGAAYNSS